MASSLNVLVFPEDLRSDENKFRTVTFSALASPNANKDKDKSIQGASQELVKTFVEKLSSVSDIASYLQKDNMTLSSQVSLPYPNNISDSQDHSWNKENGFLSTAISGGIGAIAEGVGGALGKFADKFTEGKGLKKLASGVVGDTSADTMIGQFANFNGIRKPMIDPGLFQNYTGSNPRNFVMSYTFIPNNAKEAQKIKEIILWFKMYSSPTLVSGSAVMLAPYCFNIDFGSNPYISEMFNMKCAVITNMQVEYGADGGFQLFQDGFPKQINMTLNFAESELTYANAYGADEQNVSNETSNDLQKIPESATPREAINIAQANDQAMMNALNAPYGTFPDEV